MALTQRGSVRDLVFLNSIPIALLFVYVLPQSTKWRLALDGTDPTVLTAFSTHFVHFSPAHLLVNVVGLAFVATLGYALAVTSATRRQFLTMYLVYVFVFPFFLSAFVLMLGWSGAIVGASGMVMGFIGYLPIGLVRFLGARFRLPLTAHHAVWFFLLGVALATVIALPPTYGLAIGTVAAVSTLAIAWQAVRDFNGVDLGSVRAVAYPAGNVELAAIGATTFVWYQFIAFAPDIVSADGVLNVYSHGLGLGLGFLVAYVGTTSGWLDGD